VQPTSTSRSQQQALLWAGKISAQEAGQAMTTRINDVIRANPA
jgi:hypothetical protein